MLTVYSGATSTPMMETSKAGSEHGFDYERPDNAATAALAAITDGSLAIIRAATPAAR